MEFFFIFMILLLKIREFLGEGIKKAESKKVFLQSSL